LIATLTGIAGPELQSATQALADMSTILGKDMATVTQTFIRGVNNGTDAFKRMGIVIEDAATPAERATNIIEALNDKFKGGAAIAGKTYAGSLDILKKSFGEVLESIGAVIVENPAVVATMRELGTALIGVSKYLGDNNSSFKLLAADGIIFALESLEAFIELAKLIAETLKGVFLTAIEPIKAMADKIMTIKALISGDMVEVQNIMVTAAKRAEEAWDIKAFDGVQESILNMAGHARLAKTEMVDGATVTSIAMGTLKTGIDSTSASFTASQLAAQAWAIGLAESADSVQETYAMDSEMLKAQFDAKLLTETEYLIAKQALTDSFAETEQANLNAALANKSITTEQYALANMALQNKTQLASMKNASDLTKFEADQGKLRAENLKSTIGTIAGLASSGNKTLAGIGKAAAISQATMDGFVAVNKALASAPPPFNYALAAAVGIKTASNISGIVSTPLATGIDSIPGIGGKDNFPAMLAPQERVVPRETNKDLTDFLANGGGGPKTSINVNISISDVFTSDPREVGLKIIETINEAAQANGITFLGSNIA
jgi:hypothetical protein